MFAVRYYERASFATAGLAIVLIVPIVFFEMSNKEQTITSL